MSAPTLNGIVCTFEAGTLGRCYGAASYHDCLESLLDHASDWAGVHPDEIAVDDEAGTLSLGGQVFGVFAIKRGAEPVLATVETEAREAA